MTENENIISYRLGELERLLREHTTADNDNFERLHDALLQVRIEVAALKTKASMWGGIAGIWAGAVVSALTAYLLHKIP